LKQPWPIAAALGLFATGWLILSWPWLSGSVTVPWDAKAHFFPQLVFLARSLHSGECPFWTPNVFAGHPQIADPQSLIFSPPYWLLAALDPRPGFAAADAVEFAMLYCGGAAIILFFREHDWDPTASLVAAFAFAFGSSAAWRIQHVGEVVSLAWFAIALWMLARAIRRGAIRHGFAAGLIAGFMVLGRDQVAFLGTYLLFGFLVWQVFATAEPLKLLRALALPIVAGLVGAVLVAAVPFALTYALAQDSNRAVIDLAGAERGSLHPASLLSFFIPNLFGVDGPLAKFWGPPSSTWGSTDLFLARNMTDIYIGALPAVLLLLSGVVRGALACSGVRYLTVAATAVLLYALGRYTPAFPMMYWLPGVDLFRRPADATFLLGACGALLSGYCLHRLIAPDAAVVTRRQWILTIAMLAAIFAAATLLAIDKGMIADASTPLAGSAMAMLMAFAVTALIVRLAPAPLAAMTVCALAMTIDLRINNHPNESTGLDPQKYDVLRPDTRNQTIALLKAKLMANSAPDRRDRIELAAIDFHWPNASLVHDLDHDLGYNPIRLKLFTEVTGAGDHVAIPEQRQFAPLFPSYHSIMADFIGLRYIATGVPADQIDKSLNPDDLALLAKTADAYVYENKSAMPRVLFATGSETADFAALIKTGRWPSIDFTRTVLLETPAHAGAPGATGSARILSYHNCEIVVEARSAGGGYVVLNDVWQPWWYADIDGNPAELMRANVMFRAVAVPPGDHHVRFTFRPFTGLWRQLWARRRLFEADADAVHHSARINH
jgi:hypothetical protein